MQIIDKLFEDSTSTITIIMNMRRNNDQLFNCRLTNYIKVHIFLLLAFLQENASQRREFIMCFLSQKTVPHLQTTQAY